MAVSARIILSIAIIIIAIVILWRNWGSDYLQIKNLVGVALLLGGIQLFLLELNESTQNDELSSNSSKKQ